MFEENDKKPTKEVIEILNKYYDLYEKGEIESIYDIKEVRDIEDKYNLEDEIFEENNKKGLKDACGKVIIPAIFDDINDIDYYGSNTPMIVTKDGKMGLVARDGKGTALTKFEFKEINRLSCSGNYFRVCKEEFPNRYAIIFNTELITPFKIEVVNEGQKDDIIMLYTEGKVGLVSTLYDTYVKPEYDEIIDFGEGYYFIFIKNGVKGLINKQGVFFKEEDFVSMTTEEQIKQQFLFSTTHMSWYDQRELVFIDCVTKNSSAHKVPFCKHYAEGVEWNFEDYDL
jgi:hypothetical protein